ncbi:MAG: dipeptidase [Acidimicrobiia bacterium]|nr:dipeptidase [Acidimicrobiia bacterium]
MHDDLRSAIDARFAADVADLERLVRIPSVSAPDFDPADVRRSADETATLLAAAGYQGVTVLDLEGAAPAVFGSVPAPDGAPTVLLYAHHDVQPPGEGWSSDPFEPVRRDGRLYGRGTSDDKCGVVMHAAVLRAFDGRPPVGLKVFVEGEEEVGSPNLPAFLDAHRDLLAADVIVIADSANWRVGVPAVTTSLRGLISAIVEVRTLDHAVHSGMFGGAVPDALTALTRVLASLHDGSGDVAIPGLRAFETDPLDLTEEELRAQAGVVDGVRLIGEGALTSRLWTKPAAAVLAIDAPPVGKAINALVPVARAKVSVRLAPGDDPARAMDALVAHLEGQDVWGARVAVTPLESGAPFDLAGGDPREAAFRSAFAEAWGREPVDIGIGGSIPFVAAFQEAYPEAAILLTGVGDPTSRAHGPDESLDLEELRRGILGQAIALRELGD